MNLITLKNVNDFIIKLTNKKHTLLVKKYYLLFDRYRPSLRRNNENISFDINSEIQNNLLNT